MGYSSGPKIKLFERFSMAWLHIDRSNFQSSSDDQCVAVILGPQNTSLGFNSSMHSQWSCTSEHVPSISSTKWSPKISLRGTHTQRSHCVQFCQKACCTCSFEDIYAPFMVLKWNSRGISFFNTEVSATQKAEMVEASSKSGEDPCTSSWPNRASWLSCHYHTLFRLTLKCSLMPCKLKQTSWSKTLQMGQQWTLHYQSQEGTAGEGCKWCCRAWRFTYTKLQFCYNKTRRTKTMFASGCWKSPPTVPVSKKSIIVEIQCRDWTMPCLTCVQYTLLFLKKIYNKLVLNTFFIKF